MLSENWISGKACHRSWEDMRALHSTHLPNHLHNSSTKIEWVEQQLRNLTHPITSTNRVQKVLLSRAKWKAFRYQMIAGFLACGVHRLHQILSYLNGSYPRDTHKHKYGLRIARLQNKLAKTHNKKNMSEKAILYGALACSSSKQRAL